MTPAGQYDLPASAAAPAQAREHVRAWLRDKDLTSLTDSAVLLASELVTNAVLHAGPPVHLTLSPVDAGVRIMVSDCSPNGPTRRRHSNEATTGRGLRLLDDIADAWGWDRAGDGKHVWCTVTSARDPWAAYADGTWLDSVEL